MKKFTLFFAMFFFVIGSTNAQVLSQVYNTSTYAASTANGKTAWSGNIVLLQNNLESSYGFYNPGFVAATPLSYAQSGYRLILGSPNNENAPTDTAMWFTYTATGLEVGKAYDISAVIECIQTNTFGEYAAAIWEGTSGDIPAAYKTRAYVNTNKKLSSSSAALGGEQTLSGTYTATAATMTFGIGAAKSTTGTFFNKLQIKSWSIIKNTTLGINENELLENAIIVSKSGVTLNGVDGNVQVLDIQGKILASGLVKADGTLNYNFSDNSIYIIKAGDVTKKVMFN
ncbi:hypothetical protein SLW70_16535 [Flavobacterium sp. NG2]|uniref:hypothetical protein n=1 Tax=Flavobacterium sp. NG2 TaxID=3097547 RepID=UPI002A81A6F3|nr:hypothetical protein [Flavobacterium sp. NG2]WPR71522.1 hypothetical protein SLW70_16535 [Flavobacterium sp. NG2]